MFSLLGNSTAKFVRYTALESHRSTDGCGVRVRVTAGKCSIVVSVFDRYERPLYVVRLVAENDGDYRIFEKFGGGNQHVWSRNAREKRIGIENQK